MLSGFKSSLSPYGRNWKAFTKNVYFLFPRTYFSPSLDVRVIDQPGSSALCHQLGCIQLVAGLSWRSKKASLTAWGPSAPLCKLSTWLAWASSQHGGLETARQLTGGWKKKPPGTSKVGAGTLDGHICCILLVKASLQATQPQGEGDDKKGGKESRETIFGDYTRVLPRGTREVAFIFRSLALHKSRKCWTNEWREWSGVSICQALRRVNLFIFTF